MGLVAAAANILAAAGVAVFAVGLVLILLGLGELARYGYSRRCEIGGAMVGFVIVTFILVAAAALIWWLLQKGLVS